ncbi:hypothetical protein [Kingella sp. (in: b-proteobacteria)]|uniref:hypothetical protein n=1 Tax=Kingella sp. (in: b-proteobacteria) TaxID=2020713 RepID=UPI0026DB769E|nr:hypothetical protein [Kingella sp. (in: b-proteobacteria)]MDO4656721.1 hypothetical protein [Kingella sp. (in: b-proteobacteria)]
MSIAGDETKDKNGVVTEIKPAGNSGYTIGMLQNDFGQHRLPNEETARYLLRATQSWTTQHRPELKFQENEIESFIKELSRKGNEINRENGKPLHPKIRPAVDAFLASDAGIAFTHSLDVKQIANINKNVFTPLTQTPLYQNSSRDDKIRLLAVTSKAFNQNEVAGRAVVRAIKHGRHHSLNDVYRHIDSLGGYLERDRPRALEGAEIIIAFNKSSPNNPLRKEWEHILENPLKLPTKRQGQERKEYDEILSLFFNSNTAIKTIQEKDKAVQSHSLNSDEPTVQTARHRSKPHPILARMQEQAARYRHASEVLNSGDQAAIDQMLNELISPAAQQRLVEAEQRVAGERAAREKQQAEQAKAEQAKAEQAKQQQEMVDNEPARHVAMIRTQIGV